MKIFIKNLLTIFFLTVGFFLFSGSSSVEACQIVSAATRPNGIINNYSDVTGGRPFVYLDVRTQNCNTSPSQILEVNFFAEPITAFPIDHIQTIKVEIGSGGTLSSQSNFRTSLSDFSIPIYLGEKGNGSDSGYNYCRLNGTINSTCKIFVQILNLNNGANSNPIYSLGQLGGPFPLTYTCQNFCDVSWQLGCPVGAGIAPDPLPYGVPNICSTDTATQNVTGEVPSSGSGPSATEYSTEPLAPLPGFTGDPNLGQWLESLFTILIVIAGILALIMIIVGGITYITSESFGGKGQGKAYIINAIIGLVLALGAWVILNTINPNLAEDLNLNIPSVRFDPTHEPENSVGDGVTEITLTQSDGTTTTMTACDVTKIVSVTAFGKTFKIHQGLVSSIQAINAAWEAMPEAERYVVNSIGGYNCRKVKGSNNWSSHAFGTAVDINPSKNPFGSELETDMPEAFVSLWTSQGWGWGGAWTSVKDAMHFSKYPPSEGGNGIISN